MTYALLVFMVTAQTIAPQAAAPALGTVVVQCPRSDDERSLRAQLEEARAGLLRDGKPEFEFELDPSELIAMSKGEGAH